MKRVSIFVLHVALVSALVAPALGVYGAAAPTCNDDVVGKTEEQLKADLERCNEEIRQWQSILSDTRTKVSTIGTDIKALNAKIKAAEATIRAKNIAISQLTSDIDVRSERITELETRIDEGRQSLAQILRRTNEIDDYTLVEVVLDSKNLSEFFANRESFLDVERSLETLFSNLRETITQNEEEKKRLGEIQSQELDAKYEVETQKRKISDNEKEQQVLLAATKKQEKSYADIVADRQAKANAINTALFRLRGVEGGGIPFSEALVYAKEASVITGVRAAFILGILRQESNLGVNVGQCLLVNPQNGDGKGKNTGTPFARVMKPDRDVPYFLDLMKRLGLDPYGTPVSCPQAIGYGGAMGPTQFIPSTWRSYEGRVAVALGVSTGNPWNPEHAIMATGLFLQDLGASRGGYTAEREAAGRYYAGGGWLTYGLGYAASVLRYTEQYQTDIDFLENR